MPLTEAKAQAMAALEKAVDMLTAAYRVDESEPPTMNFGYLLIVGEMRFQTPDEADEDSDEMEVTDVMGSYSKRGQSPTISLGLAHEWIRHYEQDR